MNLEQVLAKHPLPFTLKNYQVEDINALSFFDRALADIAVGAGKTVIATLLALMRESPHVLILVPPILIPQWVIWLESLNIGKVLAYEGSPTARKNLNLDVRWVVTSYGLFKNDFDRLSKYFNAIQIFTIVDEGQIIKSVTSQIHKAVRDFSMGKELLMMTGTPLSSPADVYAYCKLKTPTVYRTQRQFELMHIEKKDFFGTVTKWKNLDKMQENFRLNCVYRTKEQIAKESPKALYVPMYYKLDKAHMKLYARLMEEQLLKLDDGSKIDATTANALYHFSQQIICNLDYFSGEPDARSTAFDLLDQVCSEINLADPASSKLIVWANYKRTNATLNTYMQPYGIASAYSGADSRASVARFMSDPTCRVLGANPGSAGAGLNPQGVCNESLFLETPTRTIQFDQCCGRIDRLGQRFVPVIRIAIALGTVQEYLHKCLLKNDALVQQTLGSKKDLRAAIYGV